MSAARRAAGTCAVLALAACGASAPERSVQVAPPTERDGSTPAEGGAGVGTDPAVSYPCLPRASRTYVGFSAGMDLDDFELAAIESEHAMQAVEHTLCGAAAYELEPTGALADDLIGGRLELYEVLFTRDDASAVDVGLRARESVDAGASAGYRVAVERGAGEQWQLLAVTVL